jgi:hypothetical protein
VRQQQLETTTTARTLLLRSSPLRRCCHQVRGARAAPMRGVRQRPFCVQGKRRDSAAMCCTALRASDRARLRAVRPRRAPRRRLTRATPPPPPQARAASLAAARLSARCPACCGQSGKERASVSPTAAPQRAAFDAYRRRRRGHALRVRALRRAARTLAAHARRGGGWQPGEGPLLCRRLERRLPPHPRATRRAPCSRPQLCGAQPPPAPAPRTHAPTGAPAAPNTRACVCLRPPRVTCLGARLTAARATPRLSAASRAQPAARDGGPLRVAAALLRDGCAAGRHGARTRK